MYLIRIALLIGVVLGIAGVAFYVTAVRVPVEQLETESWRAVGQQLQQAVPADVPEQVSTTARSAREQLSTLGKRSQAVSQEVQQVLGTNTGTADSSESGSTGQRIIEAGNPPPLYQRALDHSLYLYCQAVIEEYEAGSAGEKY